MARLTHDHWRDVWESRQSSFHRPHELSPTAAVLFHMDSFREESPNPIFPYVSTDFRQFQWFENLDELAGYVLHVVFFTVLSIRKLKDAGVDVLEAPAIVVQRNDLSASTKAEAQQLLPLLQGVNDAIGGPPDVLLGVLRKLPSMMDHQQIFATAGEAVRWAMESLPEASEHGEERGDARPDDAEERAQWIADALAVDDAEALRRTQRHLMALCDES